MAKIYDDKIKTLEEEKSGIPALHLGCHRDWIIQGMIEQIKEFQTEMEQIRTEFPNYKGDALYKRIFGNYEVKDV